MDIVNFIFLHGFLGRPSDWTAVKSYLPLQTDGHVYLVDYFRDPKLGPNQSFDSWAEHFVAWVEKHVGKSGLNVLVGYSLGARLALHALERKPEMWHKAFLISANPGFEDPHHLDIALSPERENRWLSDSRWALEFMQAPWESVTKSWNAQPVFNGGGGESLRRESDYSRDLLSLALTQWSLAQQRNLRPVIESNVEKIHWMVGEKDLKFVSLGQKLKHSIPSLKVDLVPRASHRVIVENPKYVAQHLVDLLKAINDKK